MSLFGNTQSSLNQNLFGSSSSGSTLFGGNNNGQTQPLFGSLPSFGPQQNQGSTFGGQNQNNSSLFGQSTNQNQSSSLFGGNSLFGGSTNQQQFQNQSFMNNTQQNNGGSLFGGNTMQGGFNNFTNKGSNGYIFSPIRISDVKETLNYMSITVLDQFKSLSFEEIKAQDLPSRKLGSFQPASNMGLFGGSTNTNNNGFQQNNNNMNQGSSLFGGNTGGSLFGNTNNQQTSGGLFSNQNNNSSLFGGSTQNTSGGLFGGNTNNNNNNGSGLFGNVQQNNQSTGGLFGNSNTNTGTGLFGSSNQQNNNGGLFNNNNTGGGLFGNQQQNNNTNGGLFGNTTTNQGGLFGNSNNNNQTVSGGLFGSSNNTQQNSGGLFGNTNNQQNNTGGLFSKPQTGGLFGNTNTQSNTGGLFGNTNNQQTNNNTSGGLFGSSSLFGGNNNTNNQKSSLFGGSTQNSSSSLFGNTSNSSSLFGGAQQSSSLFSNTNNQPKLNLFGQPAQNQQSSSSLFSGTQQSQSTSLFGTTPPLFTNMYTPQIPVMPIFQPIPLQMQNDALNQYIFGLQKTKTLTQIISELQNDYNTTKIRKDFDDYNEHSNYDNYMTDRLSEFKDFLKFKRNNNKTRVKKSSQQPISSMNPKDVIVFKDTNNDNNKALFEPIRSDFFKKQRRDIKLKPKAHSCDMTKLAETKIIANLETSFDRHIGFKDFPSCKVPDSPFLELFIQITEPYRATFSLKVNREAKFSLLKSTIADTLKQKNLKYNDITSSSFFLMKKYAIVKETNTIKESDLEDKDTLFIILKESINKSEVSYASIKEGGIVASAKRKTKKKSELAPVEKLPILTNTEYKIIPDLKAISRMTLEELEQIENFSISNQHGKIEFEDIIDLTGVNLDQIVNILPGRVELYKNNNVSFLPQPGKGLNKKAVIHLYNISDSDDVNIELSLQYLQEKTKEINGEFKSFNRDNGEYIYKVDHF